MPWQSIADLPPSFANLPDAAKRIALHVLNANIDKGDETAIKMAWGAVKNAGYRRQGDSWVKVAKHHLQHDQRTHGRKALAAKNAVDAAVAWASSESMSGGERKARADLIHRAQYMTPEETVKARKRAGDGMARRTAARVKDVKGKAEEAQEARDRVQSAADGLKQWGEGKRPASQVVELIAAAKQGTTGHLRGSLDDDEKWMKVLAAKGYAVNRLQLVKLYHGQHNQKTHGRRKGAGGGVLAAKNSAKRTDADMMLDYIKSDAFGSRVDKRRAEDIAAGTLKLSDLNRNARLEHSRYMTKQGKTPFVDDMFRNAGGSPASLKTSGRGGVTRTRVNKAYAKRAVDRMKPEVRTKLDEWIAGNPGKPSFWSDHGLTSMQVRMGGSSTSFVLEGEYRGFE